MRNCRVLDVAQRSDAWRAAHLGLVTGSFAGDMFAIRKDKKEAAPRRDLRTRLVTERLTRVCQMETGYVSDDIQRGIDLEPLAIQAYEAKQGVLVRQTGFIASTILPIGCSLDGDVDDLTGIVEIKCPRAATHLDYLKGLVVPPNYLPQVLHNLFVTGAEWADFVSFCPQYPAPLRLFIARLYAKDADLAAYELVLRQFLAEVEKEYHTTLALYAPAGEPAA